MTSKSSSRRTALKQMASMGVLGVINSLRSTPLAAMEHQSSSSKALNGFKGKVITRKDDNYEIWRQSMHWHQSKPNRYPDMIVQAQSVEDVIAAVNHAAINNLKIALKSGGHNAAGSAMRNGGMLLDVANLNKVEIDSGKQIASIQPGVKSIQLVTEAHKQGLSFPAPHCPSVGLSGFTMGGGIGWNYSAHGGMSCFSIDSAEVVLANGKLVTASANENPDLLWAIRGGGQGFFGAVTRLNLKLYPTPRAIHASNYILPLDKLDLVTRTLDELVETTDDRVELLIILAHNPAAAPDTPPERAKICMVTVFCFADTAEEAIDLLQPVSQSALGSQSIVKEENQPFSFEGLYDKYFSLEVPAGMLARYKVDNVMTNDPGKVLHALKDHFVQAPSPHTHILAAYGMNLKARADVCFSSIASAYLGCYAIWDEAKNDDLNLNWLGEAIPLMDPYAKGHYVNEVEPSLNPDRMRQCYSNNAWMRLEQLRTKYDPAGVFHHFLGQG
jgi:FAD/FMN-containing dehydrogenase